MADDERDDQLSDRDISGPRRQNGSSRPEAGDSPPDTGNSGPDTGNSGPDTGNSGPDTGNSGPDHTEDGLDEFDNLVLDESFVRGGAYEPPARTRLAIARYGDQQTSWRHAGGITGRSGRDASGPGEERAARRGRGSGRRANLWPRGSRERGQGGNDRGAGGQSAGDQGAGGQWPGGRGRRTAPTISRSSSPTGRVRQRWSLPSSVASKLPWIVTIVVVAAAAYLEFR